MITKINLAVVYLSLALLSACGGGGGGVTSSIYSNPYAAPLPITTSNYAGVATDSVARANGTSNASAIGKTIVGAQISESGSFSLKNMALSTATTVLDHWAVFDNPTIVGVVKTEIVNCAGGGVMSLSGEDADNSRTLTGGDKISAAFTNCYENGLRLNGSLSMVINSYSGNLSTFGSASLTMTFNNLNSGSDAINGSLTFVMSKYGATSGSVTLIMPSMVVFSSGDYFTFSGFNMTVTENASSASLNMVGTISSSKYGGSVVISTPNPVVTDSLKRVTGTILITGKDATKARIVGQGTTSILIDADTTGNGTFDVKTTVISSSLGL